MSRDSKNNLRQDLAEEDQTYFRANPDAGFHIRGWTPADARCGTRAFDRLNLVGSPVLVFRCGARIPMMITPAAPQASPVLAGAIARQIIEAFPDFAQDWHDPDAVKIR